MTGGSWHFWLPKLLPVFGIIAVFVLVYVGAERVKSEETLAGKLGGLLMAGIGLLVGFIIVVLIR